MDRKATAMTDDFSIKSRTEDAIVVRQARHDHVYVFSFRQHEGRRFLGTGPIFGNAKASVSAVTLLNAARTFAEREARKLDLID